MTEHKSFDVRVKGLAGDSGEVELYAAVFSNVDHSGEVIQPGAFKDLSRFVSDGFLTTNHQWDRLPIATIESASQDSRGLKITAHFHSTKEAQDARTVVKERLSRSKKISASIGYKVLADEKIMVAGKSVRSLRAIDLIEASLVSVGANAEAGVIGAKSFASGSIVARVMEQNRRFLEITAKHDGAPKVGFRRLDQPRKWGLFLQFLDISSRHGRLSDGSTHRR